MISTAWVQMMAAYNAEMNRRLYDAAARLTDEERRADRGAFWGSLHGTFNHLLWADEMWMSRFANWPAPEIALKDSSNRVHDFSALRGAREGLDRRIVDWAEKLDDSWMEGDIVWFSGAAKREIRARRTLLLAHFFNHQTHHRGQAHALLTRAGEQTDDTDLFLVLPEMLARA